jgi:hypothetical protein
VDCSTSSDWLAGIAGRGINEDEERSVMRKTTKITKRPHKYVYVGHIDQQCYGYQQHEPKRGNMSGKAVNYQKFYTMHHPSLMRKSLSDDDISFI